MQVFAIRLHPERNLPGSHTTERGGDTLQQTDVLRLSQFLSFVGSAVIPVYAFVSRRELGTPISFGTTNSTLSTFT
jgi:hypothetical protein